MRSAMRRALAILPKTILNTTTAMMTTTRASTGLSPSFACEKFLASPGKVSGSGSFEAGPGLAATYRETSAA
jgi:hypothetical protein